MMLRLVWDECKEVMLDREGSERKNNRKLLNSQILSGSTLAQRRAMAPLELKERMEMSEGSMPTRWPRR